MNDGFLSYCFFIDPEPDFVFTDMDLFTSWMLSQMQRVHPAILSPDAPFSLSLLN